MPMEAEDDDTADLNPSRAEWRRLATEFVDQLLLAPDEETLVSRLREVAQKESFHVARALLAEARSCARSDPLRAATLAEYAILAAEQSDPSPDSTARRASLLALAFCHLAQAFRLVERLDDAEKAFRRAACYLSTVALADLDVRVVYLSLLADLREDQGRPEEAEDLRLQADVLEESLS